MLNHDILALNIDNKDTTWSLNQNDEIIETYLFQDQDQDQYTLEEITKERFEKQLGINLNYNEVDESDFLSIFEQEEFELLKNTGHHYIKNENNENNLKQEFEFFIYRKCKWITKEKRSGPLQTFLSLKEYQKTRDKNNNLIKSEDLDDTNTYRKRDLTNYHNFVIQSLTKNDGDFENDEDYNDFIEKNIILENALTNPYKKGILFYFGPKYYKRVKKQNKENIERNWGNMRKG